MSQCVRAYNTQASAFTYPQVVYAEYKLNDIYLPY